MDRFAEQVVVWHNSHPLAKRISIYDVHTIGVVALPFMRSGGAGLPGDPNARGPIEPVLTDAVSTESLAAWGTEESTIAANTNAAHLDALADQEEPPPSVVKPGLVQRLLAIFKRGAKAAGAAQSWPAFSEKFVDKLSAKRVARFAQQHGYTARPGDATWPHRVVPIDDQMMSGSGGAGGAWPFEMYLMCAAIDAGRARTRVLAGRSAGAALPPIIGRRCLDPKRVGIAALIPLCVVTAASAAFWHRGAGTHEETMASAAVAASAPASASSSSASGLVAHTAVAASEAASALGEGASAPVMVAEAAASAASALAAESAVAEAAAGSAPPIIPDIRPRFVETARPPGYKGPPLQAAVPMPSAPASGTAALKQGVSTVASNTPAKGEGPASAKGKQVAVAPQEAPEVPVLPMTSVRPDVAQAAAKGTPVVALVAPPMRNKAEAEATLARMRDLVVPLQPDPKLMQAQLFESPEGWRPAVWPFASRIEAQLVNATLVARGLHTKAVNF